MSTSLLIKTNYEITKEPRPTMRQHEPYMAQNCKFGHEAAYLMQIFPHMKMRSSHIETKKKQL